MNRILVVFLSVAVLAACSGLNTRHDLAPSLAQNAQWTWREINAGVFTLATAAPANKKGRVLTVYIEGDGFAYKTNSEPAMDPTPITPMSLELATRHPGQGPVAYLARPCQFVKRTAETCPNIYWTTSRYAPVVIDAMSAAVDQLKTNAEASGVILVGYSGGGAIAALLAERRNDVAGLVTVAANLDVTEWTTLGHWAPLSGSLDPATDTSKLAHMRQVHFHGADDKVVPAAVTQSFMSKLPKSAPAVSIEVATQAHQCCWQDKWHELATRPDVTAISGWMSGN